MGEQVDGVRHRVNTVMYVFTAHIGCSARYSAWDICNCFAIISAKGGMRGKAVAGIVTGIFGIIIGLIIYAMILFVVVQLKDQRILNQFRPEQIKVIQDYIQMYIAH